MEDCIFCKIVNKEIPSYTIYEDDVVLVFLSIDPMHNGHTLMIPKKHYTDFCDIDKESISHIYDVAKDMYDLLYDKLKFDGLKFVQNNGSYQDIKHYHLHLIPDYKNEVKKSLDEVYEMITK